MPRAPRRPCKCGCGQATTATSRTRALECVECGTSLRMSREAFATAGVPVCGCGGQFMPRCLEDRAAVPGDVGREAWAELIMRPASRGGPRGADYTLSSRARKAAATRAAHRSNAARRDPATPVDMPF